MQEVPLLLNIEQDSSNGLHNLNLLERIVNWSFIALQ